MIIYHLLLAITLIMIGIMTINENCVVWAMSKRFLKGFIMGAMFAKHHKP